MSGASRSQLPGCSLLARDDLEAPVLGERDLGVVQMARAARDAVARGEVLVLRREAQVVDRAAPAADAIRRGAGRSTRR